VCDAIEAIAAGQTVIDEPLRRALVAERQAHGDRRTAHLSPRELEVLTLTATGMSAPEVGRRLYIAAATVKTHLHRIYEKLGVSDRTAMVAEAMRRGLIE
jgi:two-component system, NarL family, nitrate/nitrite response regulator NarL